MKTSFFALIGILIMLPISLFAQNDHMTFKGVPIDGTLRQFTTKLTQKGFSQMGVENDYAVMNGDFAGYKNCDLLINTVERKDLVYMVSVKFPDLDQWGLLEGNYLKLKRMLTTKYGEPSEVIERFQYRQDPKTDFEKLFALQYDQCTFKTIFKTEKGRIGLFLAHEGLKKCYVVLTYIDGINGSLAEDLAMEDL